MTVTFDTSVLSSWYQTRSGTSASGSTGSGGATKPKDPTPPWSATATTPRSSALAKAVMAGGRFIDTTAAKLDAPTSKQSGDYKALFSLYQGLNALAGLTEQATAKGVGATELARIRTRFAAGMAEVGKYIDTKPFTDFEVAQGTVVAKAQTGAGAKVETDTYQTKALYAGQPTDEVPAFAGDVRFTMTAAKTGSVQVPVTFDLAEMGATPRSMSNVTSYVNGKLNDAGLSTRLQIVRTPDTPRTVKSGTGVVTLPVGPDSFSWKIKGSSTEALSFAAPTTTPAVYVTQASGSTAPKQELVKFNADASATAVGPPAFKTALGSAAAAARATATGPDGSVYVLADVTGPTDGQAIKGARDVALNKYDSAGNLVYSRTVGASGSASGFALSVSADGSKVAVAGSITGALDSGTIGADKTLSDSFVTVFNGAGEEQWTQRRGAAADDQPSGVAFGGDGSVYVTGTAASAMPGASAAGGVDGYLQGFSATGVAKFATQFGTASTDKPAGLVVSGSSVVVAGTEGADAVVRRYDLQSTGGPILGAVRNLGPLDGGGVAGVALADDGSVIVAGSTHNGALDAGTVTQAYDGGRDGFAAKLSADLQPGGADTLTYIGGDQDRTVTGVAASGGQVYLTGQLTATPPPGQTTAFDGYALAVNTGSGAVGWSTTMRGVDTTDAPASISVAASGSSVLDKLGLPSGKIDYAQSKTLVATTALRAGDQFFLSPGPGKLAKAVTIEASDTLDSLATKIARASGFAATATVAAANGVRTLKITPVNARAQVEITAGPTGRNALGALGLSEGLIETATTVKPKVGDPTADGKTYGLALASSFDLSTAEGFKKAQSAVMAAASTVRTIYREMNTDVAAPSSAKGGAVPAYLTAQLSNYQAALNRLTGG